MIKIFIGTDSDIHQKAEKVVKYSILKNTSQPVDVQFIQPGWRSPGPTGFTLHRFLIPELYKYQGYAIYLDVDMLVLGDIKELWDYQTPGKWCTTKWTSKQINDDVSVIDCGAFKDLPKNEQLKIPKVFDKTHLRTKIGGRYYQNIPQTWNSIDYLDSNTKLLHYSCLGTQPWHPVPNKIYKTHKDPAAVELFFQYLKEAEANGY